MLHLMILLPNTDACADVVAACAWEVVYTPESIGGVTAIALQYADATGCAAFIRPPLLHVHATCVLSARSTPKVGSKRRVQSRLQPRAYQICEREHLRR